MFDKHANSLSHQKRTIKTRCGCDQILFNKIETLVKEIEKYQRNQDRNNLVKILKLTSSITKEVTDHLDFRRKAMTLDHYMLLIEECRKVQRKAQLKIEKSYKLIAMSLDDIA